MQYTKNSFAYGDTTAWDLGFLSMTKGNIALDHESALKALREQVHPCIRRVLRGFQRTSSLKEFEFMATHSAFRAAVLLEYQSMLPQLRSLAEKQQELAFRSLFLRHTIDKCFGIDLMEETTMTALMYAQWYNGQQKIYLVEQELYDGLSLELESSEKLAPITPITTKLNYLMHKVQSEFSKMDSQTIREGSNRAKIIQHTPEYERLMELQQRTDQELFECDGWRMENPPPIREEDIEPTMVILPNGRTLLVCAGRSASLTSRFGNAWKKRLHHKSSRYIEKLMFQIMLNAHNLLQKLDSGFFVCQFNTFKDFNKTMGNVPYDSDEEEISFAGSTIYVNYDIQHMKHLYADSTGVRGFWLDARKSARETLNFISALQHPKTIVTSVKSSESRKKRRKKKFNTKYQPRLCTIKVDPETLSLIRPLRDPSQRTGREMPRFDVPEGKANRWVTRASLRVGEVVLATKQGKRNNRLYLVNRPRVGYTCNEHKEPLVRAEKAPKIIKAKRF